MDQSPKTPLEPSAEGSRDPSAPIRLQAFIARCGASSRRAAEALILAGRVQVNGEKVTELGTKVGLGDRVSLDGKDLEIEANKRHIVLNKPRGFVSTMDDPEGRPLAVGLIKPYVSERIYNVGRLDQWSQGLLLFTNDGDFAAKVGHPSSGIEKEYELRCSVDIPDSLLAEFVEGLVAEGQRYRAEKARKIEARVARIILVEGRNREIRRVFASRSIQVESLVRVRIGPVLIGDLAEGAFRELTGEELRLFSGARPQ
ncbi:MAG TPA: pseudouridine synthase [Rectinemataceae bacterium]|nr:pseudouridine synthase [Rectinemataceae bacterium]